MLPRFCPLWVIGLKTGFELSGREDEIRADGEKKAARDLRRSTNQVECVFVASTIWNHVQREVTKPSKY